MTTKPLASTSFRDPAGFMFEDDGKPFRQVNRYGRDDYERLVQSGLYDELASDGLLVSQEEVDPAAAPTPDAAYKVLAPRPIDLISYPYEWCFSQLQDAALTTLEAQRRAVARGMSLKDASAYNVQFHEGRPILIDTLSFEGYREGEPWVAYRQFCQHFLAPLTLMSLVDVRLNQLCRANIDGVPLDLAARLLPFRTRFRPGLALHLHAHARMNQSAAGRPRTSGGGRFSRTALLGLIDHLESTVKGLRGRAARRGWLGYYQDNTYTDASIAVKERLVADCLDRVDPRSVWDLGANTGRFSRVASGRSIPTAAFDVDLDCVEANYQEVKKSADRRLLPLLLDLFNPSPGLGWANRERASIFDRGTPDLILALALVHHLAFTGNLPLENIAAFFEGLAPWLAIEFVPPDDPQTERLKTAVDGVHHPYDQARFEAAFSARFETVRREPVLDSGRVLYLFRRRTG